MKKGAGGAQSCHSRSSNETKTLSQSQEGQVAQCLQQTKKPSPMLIPVVGRWEQLIRE